MYYAGQRAAGDRFDVPAAVALAIAAMGQAKYAEDEGTVKTKTRRYKRRDMVAQ
jgi:hypothetical protein